MTPGAYLAAVATLALVVAPWTVAGWQLARAAAPTWPAAMRALATTTIAVGGVVVSAELVGSFGQFRRVPLAIACVVLGTAVVVAARRFWPRPDVVSSAADPVDWRGAGWPAVLALAACCLTLGQWSQGVWSALRHGIVDVDSVGYHLPQAARFVQDHGTTALHYASPNAGTAYYPANSELLHAVGMVTTRVDVLSPFVTFTSLLLCLLAAYCIGRRLGAPAAAMAGVCVFAAAPILAVSIAGSAYNDFTAIGFLLAAIAFALHASHDAHGRVAIVLAGLAAGLALGTKLTVLAPVGGLTITMWWITRRRAADLLSYSAAVAVGGGYWFVRNWVHVGNPVPSLHLGIFPEPPMKLVEQLSPAVSGFLFKRNFLLHIAPGGLLRFFGYAWPLLGVLVAVSVIAWLLALRRETRLPRAALVGVVVTIALSILAYVVTPTTAGNANGFPFLFVYNLRYVLPAFIPAFVLLPALPVLARRQAFVTAAALALVLVTLASKPHARPAAFGVAVVIGFAVVAVTSLPAAARRAALGGAVVLALVAGLPVTRSFERHRFADSSTPRARLFNWGRSVPPGARVALVGLALQYPFDGPHFATRVEYLGVFKAKHEFTNIDTCNAWRRALRDGRFDFVVAEPPDQVKLPPAATWTATLPGARVPLQTAAGAVIDVRSVTSWPAC